MLNCCPIPSYIADFGIHTCPESFGQINKIVLFRSSVSSFTLLDMVTLSVWTTYKAYTDYRKMVVTPYLGNPTMEGGEAMTWGGGNETPSGEIKTAGTNPTKLTFTLHEYTSDIIRNLKELECESLQMYIINELGMFGGLVDNLGSVSEEWIGIPIYGLHVSDKVIGGHGKPDYYTLSFYVKQLWSTPNYGLTTGTWNFGICDPTANFNALIL